VNQKVMSFVSRWPAQRRASKTTTGKNLPGMSANSVRQALTRQTGFALHGANQSQELVAITPYDRCRSSTITTIIQHSAENLHENTRDEATKLGVLTGYLWLVLGLASFLRTEFSPGLFSPDASVSRGTRPPAVRSDIFHAWEPIF
jgi:hypothetical protein